MALPQEKIYTMEDIYALLEGQRAELIDGRIYMMAPPNTVHQRISYSFARKISDYIDKRKGNCEVFLAVTANLNCPQKNILIGRILPCILSVIVYRKEKPSIKPFSFAAKPLLRDPLQ